jgi:hypothetical protein
MNKKVLAVLLVLVLAVSGLFAKDLGIKVGGQLGWGFDIGRMKLTDSSGEVSGVKVENNGFAFNLTGEYDFDQNWGVKANFGMMFAGKAGLTHVDEEGSTPIPLQKEINSGLYIDFAVDAKYTYAINDTISVAGLAGLELVSGYFTKDPYYAAIGHTLGTGSNDDISPLYNVAFGINLGVEGSYKITDEISVVGGVTGAWFFVNSAKIIKSYRDEWSDSGEKISVASFYIRPYIGATYAL